MLKKEIAPISGVKDLSFDVLNGKMTVAYDEAKVSEKILIDAVKRTGMRAEVYRQSNATDNQGSYWERWGRAIFTSLSGAFLLAAFTVNAITLGLEAAISEGEPSVPLISKLLYLSAAVLGAWFVLPKAWLSLKRFRPDMNLLMTIAVIGALLIGEWFEAATVSFLFAFSLALESWSVSRARRAIAALMELAPLKARIIGTNGVEEEVDAGIVTVGTRILVKPGEKIPLDGKVVSGSSSANQAPITGESMPVSKTVGDETFAGTINEDGAIEIEVSKPASESTLSKIVKLVEDAQSKRSASEQWVEKFARYYTPIVMVTAVLVALLPPLIFSASWELWLYQALVLLVIACPCALVISTPVSIVSSLVAAAKNGVLVKGGTFMELPAQLKVIAMDKTGTLTQGKPEVEAIVPLSGHSENELLTIATAIEKRSEHPLAHAIVRFASARSIDPLPVENYTAIKGKGATAVLNGKNVWLGSHRYLEERGEESAEMHSKLEELSAGGRSVVIIGEEGHVCGFIALADKVRDNANESVRKFKELGIKKVIMLTGDNTPTGKAIGKLTGVDEVKAELLPEDKVRIIEDLVKTHGIVAMIGDGVNDAPALARASIGIAMGAGSDAALETADVALMKDDLSRIPWLIGHSKRTLRIIRQNISLSLAVKALFVILTFSGHASLWMAIASDTGVSLLVVMNALRLLR